MITVFIEVRLSRELYPGVNFWSFDNSTARVCRRSERALGRVESRVKLEAFGAAIAEGASSGVCSRERQPGRGSRGRAREHGLHLAEERPPRPRETHPAPAAPPPRRAHGLRQRLGQGVGRARGQRALPLSPKVTILRKRAARAGALRSEQAVNAARRQGLAVDTQPKRGGGSNKKPAAQGAVNAAKLDAETEELRHERVSLDLGKRLQQSRLAKGWTQKELATKINEKPQVVNEYEAGRAIPNPAVITKMEKALGTKLRGKERAAPAATASAPAAAAGARRR